MCGEKKCSDCIEEGNTAVEHQLARIADGIQGLAVILAIFMIAYALLT